MIVICFYHAMKPYPWTEEFLKDNLLIKGDSLPVLKSLKPHLYGKVKLIYIDPPYNTKKKTALYNDTRSHEEWFEFMKSRLEVVRDLLRDDGIIFISIDDNAQAQLKILMDSIFRASNFISQVVWESSTGKNDQRYISRNHEYILIYKKSSDLKRLIGLPRTEKQNKRYKNPDNDPRGVWKPDNFTCCGKGYRYEITIPSGKKILPDKARGWRCNEEKYKKLLADNRMWFGKDGNNVPSYKLFLSEVQNYIVVPSIWHNTDVGMSGTKELQKLFNGEKVFNFPKGTKLIKHILQIATKPEDNDIILDFFAGSGTTGHAVLEKNLEEKLDAVKNKKDPNQVGNRKYIMVQLDEPIAGESKFKTIFDICHERMIRVENKLKEENADLYNLNTSLRVL
jgi:adenine-specific DNA-methyltransferase